MESPSLSPSLSPSRARDRISGLPDDVLGHILSFLPNDEAGRAAVLCRRWCDVFGHVHTISFEEREGERNDDWYTYYLEATERRSCSTAIDRISAALLCRRRCAGGHVPLRTFRFAFDKFMDGLDTIQVDQWLSYVLEYARQELNLDLRFVIEPICHHDRYSGAAVDDNAGSDSDDDETGLYRLPRRLFSCAALKTLCLSHCLLKLPEAIHLPCLETLRLTNIRHDSGRSVQRLVSSCPRLDDLTLEAFHHLRTLTVLHRRLCRFALRCCHSAKSIQIDASELRSIEFRGYLPRESLVTLHGLPASRGITSCTLALCTPVSKSPAKLKAFRRFLWSFAASKRLHLHHQRLHTKCLTADGLPLFFHMTHLVLQGRVHRREFIGAVRGMLEQTPNLEVLSLHMAEEKERLWERVESGCLGKAGDAAMVMVPDGWGFSKTPCLRLRVREINMEHYEGNETQRTLARLLFANAIVLERVRVVFAGKCFAVQARLEEEIESWAKDGSERIFM
ncbi:hypothetical protein QYE76_039893 [Lolium multiflorum]|uniref:F-box domain-containing protein n=1 Tax=Lolium multiflorum TaxID=4521 RepID=A0AAD8TAR3_LOLMU|nr:hypothetical protein QYE76_039893 [Lolium multiflorum]